MALSIDFTDAVLSLTAHGSGLGEIPRLNKRIERLARAAGRPFGVLLDLSDGRPADEAELTALLTQLLFELPDHGLRELALVLLDAVAGTDGLARAQLVNITQARLVERDPHRVVEMLARLTHDHYLVVTESDRYRFCYSVVQRWWRHRRLSAMEGDGDVAQAALDQ